MLDCWNELAIKNGFDGMVFAYQQLSFHIMDDRDEERFTYNIEYQPSYARYDLQKKQTSGTGRMWFVLKTSIRKGIMKWDSKFGTNLSARFTRNRLQLEDYDELCKTIIEKEPDSEKAIPGMFVGWDNTPRRGNGGRVCVNSTPEKFHYYMKKQLINANKKYKKDMIFIFAWNEWAEGGYLEPDTYNKYEYLQALKNSLEETDMEQ